jgi:hypothetical protein
MKMTSLEDKNNKLRKSKRQKRMRGDKQEYTVFKPAEYLNRIMSRREYLLESSKCNYVSHKDKRGLASGEEPQGLFK